MAKEIKELLSLVKADDKAAFSELEEMFRPLIVAETVKLISSNPFLRSDEDEIRQEALIGLYKAAGSYRADSSSEDLEQGSEYGSEDEAQELKDVKVTFGLYAKICIHNRMISYLRKARSRKAKQEKALAAQRSSHIGSYADEFLGAIEQNSEIRRLFDENMTSLEKRIFLMYLDNKSYKEIASEVGKTEKSVDNAIYRVKTKMKKLLT